MTEPSKNSIDTYQESIASILSFYDVQVDVRGIVDSIATNERGLQPNDINIIAKKLDFSCKTHKVPFNKLNSINAPVILILKDGACTYYPSNNGQGQFVIAGQESQNDKDNYLDIIKESYTGRLISLYPKQNTQSLDIAHMKQRQTQNWFWDPITSLWGKYAEVVLCSIFINLLALAVPLFTMNVYDRVVTNFVPDTLIVLTLGVIVALVFDFFFKLMRAYILERVASEISVKHDYDLMERMVHIKDVDMAMSAGEKTNIFRELHSIRDFYASRLVPTLVDVPFFLLFTLVIYMIAPPLAAVPITAAIIILVVNLAGQIPMNRSTANYFQSMQNKSTALLEMLGGVHTMKTLNAAGYKLMKWKLASQAASKCGFANNIILAAVNNLSGMITQIGYVSIIFIGVYQIEAGILTVGGLIACSIIYSRAVTPVVGFSNVLSRLKQSRDVLETIDNIFQIPHEDVQSRQKAQKGPFKGAIEIRDLSYQYPGQARPALYKNTLKIKAGEHIGLIGQTGAGKTTLNKIISGLITPSEGSIFLDSFAYQTIPETELNRSIGYVPQDPFFFNGTIRENILLGAEQTISKAMLDKSIQLSGLDLVMQQTGEGLDMDVGENGKKLSGGQRQAISLARAVIRDPQILVFDEPTTGMDNTLEERVKASLQKFIQTKTFIMVTHRTSLLSLVDRLVFIDKGQIVADGPRDDIMKKLAGK